MGVMHGEDDDELIFLYSLKEGYVEYSYAAHVAKSVGIQANVVDRANEVNITLMSLKLSVCRLILSTRLVDKQYAHVA